METKFVFHKIPSAPFTVHGLLPYKKEDGFRRMPESAFEVMTAPLMKEQRLHTNTAGGRVRFRTDAKEIWVKADTGEVTYCANGNNLLHHNFDLYREFGGKEIFECTFVSWSDEARRGVVNESRPLRGDGMREFTLYMPCYGNVYSLEIGLPEGARIQAATPYKFEKPVVFLGSSITQGGCAARNGITYQGYLSRRIGFDYINLGFSGSCRAEKELMEYIATVPMSAFVYDYDHNAPTIEHYEETHKQGYDIIRKKNPDIPIILVSKPTPKLDDAGDIKRRIIVQKTFHHAVEQGDKNIYYIDGYSLFGGIDREDCTTDGCHPNDLGMIRMADMMTHTLHFALNKNSTDTNVVEKVVDVW